jgi:thioredoxin-related protein
MRWLLILGAFLASPAFAQEPPEWFSESFLDIREDAAEAAKEGKRLMLYFHQDGCPYCKQLVAVNWRQPQIVEKTRRYFVPVALNIWGAREVTASDGRRMSEKQFGAMLRIQFTPTLVFFDEKGAVAHRINGYLPPEEFFAALDGAIGGAPAAAAPGTKPVDLRRKAGSKPVAVLLLSPGCDACDELERNLRLPEVRAQLARFELIRLSNPAAVTTAAGYETLQSGYVPSLVLFNPQGREVLRTDSYLRRFHLAGALEYVGTAGYTREPSFQRFLQAKAERMRIRGERVDLWN